MKKLLIILITLPIMAIAGCQGWGSDMAEIICKHYGYNQYSIKCSKSHGGACINYIFSCSTFGESGVKTGYILPQQKDK